MKITDYSYPSYEIPILSAYGGKFEAAFIMLHPFVETEHLASIAPNFGKARTTVFEASKFDEIESILNLPNETRYPKDEAIINHGKKISWKVICKNTGIADFKKLNQALLTSIGALRDEFEDKYAAERLNDFLVKSSMWSPGEGRFEPLLQRNFIEAMKIHGAEKIIYIPEVTYNPELGDDDPNMVETAFTSELEGRTGNFPSTGTLIAEDCRLLFTVDWDSFFTVAYGERLELERIVDKQNLEGFFANEATVHAWWNE